MNTNKIREAVEFSIEKGNSDSVIYGIVPELLREIERLQESNRLMEKALEKRG